MENKEEAKSTLFDKLKHLGLLPEAVQEKQLTEKLKNLDILRIGVLAFQGDFAEHIKMLKLYPDVVEPVLVKKKEHLENIHGLIIPGGESTTFGILAERFGMLEPLREFCKTKAVWGTCAGLIMISNEHTGVTMKNQKFIGGMDVVCERNFFGAQYESFSTTLDVQFSASKVAKMQAEKGENQGEGVRVLSKVKIHKEDKQFDVYVAAEDKNLLASSFHPELSGERDFHEYYLSRVVAYL